MVEEECIPNVFEEKVIEAETSTSNPAIAAEGFSKELAF